MGGDVDGTFQLFDGSQGNYSGVFGFVRLDCE
jgi:hypothetical protein